MLGLVDPDAADADGSQVGAPPGGDEQRARAGLGPVIQRDPEPGSQAPIRCNASSMSPAGPAKESRT